MRVGGETLARVAALVNCHPRLTGLKTSAALKRAMKESDGIIQDVEYERGSN